jgi:NTE family protein
MATSRFTWLVACLGCAVFALEASAQQTRPVVGVALGGGNARGFAHVGVLRWFEDHHVPIDVVAGTSMGGLIGGAYAAGMSSTEVAALLRTTDWDEVFSASAYRYKSIRRRDDARANLSPLEQVRRGVALPSALNNGQQVDFMLARIGALYAGLPSFDALPTPFRCVAVDQRTATAMVLDSGSLPVAMRATMALPGILPPIELRGRVLVDGGAMDNVPADVVRAMGADVVIAVDVGSSNDTNDVRFSAFGLVNNTVGAMKRANTRRARGSATLVVEPDLESFSAGDWRRAGELAVVGYRAAESMSADLLPLAVDEITWRRYLADRAAKRRARMPTIARVEVRGATPADTKTIQRRLEWQLREPLNPDRIENDLLQLGGVNRYMSIGWDLSAMNGAYVLVIKARSDRRAPLVLLSSSAQ